ncbi:MAG: hypothetical protein ABW166_05600 [Sedimenticola sp.]
MPQKNIPQRLVTAVSITFILWFILWVILLLILPSEQYTPLFLTLGIIPVIGWFAIKPSRIIWFFSTLLGINGLDR